MTEGVAGFSDEEAEGEPPTGETPEDAGLGEAELLPNEGEAELLPNEGEAELLPNEGEAEMLAAGDPSAADEDGLGLGETAGAPGQGGTSGGAPEN